MATTYLSYTQGTPTNNLKWTWSSWIKRGELATAGHSAVENIFTTYVDASNLFYVRFNDTDFIDIRNIASVGTGGRLITNAKYRDVAAWYHIVVVYDSANASAGDRVRLYVNGVEETSFSLDTNPSSSQVCTMNADTRVVELGRISDTSANFTGVLAHTHFCDGQAYAASDFGETDATSGIWIAKSGPSVTYGNNGFFLKYASGAHGTDSSGNSNDFVVSGTMTNTKDTPDNNFCTSTPIVGNADSATNLTLSNGNLTTTVIGSGQTNWGYPSSMGVTKGKWYMEYEMGSTAADVKLGIISDTGMSIGGTTPTAGRTMRAPGLTTATYGLSWAYSAANGQYYTNDSGTAYGDSFTSAGDIIGCAFDADTGKVYFSKDGVWQNSGDPAAGSNPMVTITMEDGVSYFFLSAGYSDDNWDVNYGNGYFGTTLITSPEADDAGEGAFKYDVPAGFYALCTNNIATYG